MGVKIEVFRVSRKYFFETKSANTKCALNLQLNAVYSDPGLKVLVTDFMV